MSKNNQPFKDKQHTDEVKKRIAESVKKSWAERKARGLKVIHVYEKTE